MTNNELFYFTGKCLTLDEQPEFREELIEICQSGQIDWQRFVSICSNHLILPVIYLKFRSNGILNSLPEELSEHLKDIHELNFTRNTLILKQVQEITLLLNRNNISPVFLKGSAHLLDALYSDLGERILGDIDFLVSEDDYLRTAAIMEKEAYVRVEPGEVFQGVENLKHYPRLIHPDFVAVIEIHRMPVGERFQSWFNSTLIDQEKKEVPLLKGCYVLSEKHKVIHNFIHSQLSNGGHATGIMSFRDLYDLYLLSGRSDIRQTLSGIKYPGKAIAYFVFAGKALGISGKIYPGMNLQSRILLKKHALNQRSPAFYRFNRTVVFIREQLVTKYLFQLWKAIYSRKMRRSLLNRVGNRDWYQSHLDYLKGSFNPKNH